MKNSGIPWIGEIPEKWKLERLKSQVVEINEKNSPLRTDYVLSLTIKDGVIPYEEKGDVGNKAKENHEEYKLAYPDTIVLNSMNILIGAVGICKYYGCVSPVYYVFKAADSSDLRYLNYIMSSTPYQKYLRKYANGILEIRLRVSSDDILKRHIPLPPLSEQQAIADFLDKKCAEIDQLVALQEKFIEELKAYKQSLITETVTKGLNPNAKMKDSGVEWIGEIPEGWKIVRIKNILKDSSLQTSTGLEEQLSVTQNKGIIKSSEVQIANPSMSQIGWKIVKKGDIVFNKYKAHSGVFFVSPHNGIVTFNYSVYHCSDAIVPKFYEYVFKTPPCICEFRKAMKGVGESISPLYTCDLFSINIFLPPLSQQQEMTNYITAKNKEIDELILIKQKKIEELKEYKKSLIYEYVTGKKEVTL